MVDPDPLLTVDYGREKKTQSHPIRMWSVGRYNSKVQPLLRSYTTKIDARAYWEADKVIFMNDAYASRFSVRKKHGVIIPNGINLNLYNPVKYDRAMLRRDFDMVDKTFQPLLPLQYINMIS